MFPTGHAVTSSPLSLQHSDSTGDLLGARRSLQPTDAVRALGSSLDKAGDERPNGKEDKPGGLEEGDSEDRSPPGRDPRAGSPACERGLEPEEDRKVERDSYKDDVLLEDDQEEERRQRAEEEKSILGEQRGRAEAEAEERGCPEAEERGCPEAEERLAEEVSEEAPPHRNLAQQAESGGLHVIPAASPPLPLRQPEAKPSESQEASREVEEEESDSSAFQLDTSSSSTVMNGEISEEEGGWTQSGSISPSSEDQANAPHSPSKPPSSSLSSEDLVSPACPSPLLGSNNSAPHLHEQTGPLSEPPQPPGALSTTPASGRTSVSPPEEERRSTLSKQDRLLIHKIRRYYEHAEHEDTSFSIKRRESLSYIPRGLVRHLSRQLDGPQDALPPQRNTSTHTRPTSWAVFGLPGLEGDSQSSSQNTSHALPGLEEFRPASEMVHVWQDMELEEKRMEDGDGEGRQVEETLQKNNQEEALRILEESNRGPISEEASFPSLTPSPAREYIPGLEPCPGRPPRTRERVRLARAPLPRIISLRSGAEEDMILQDMEKVKNKVFQLARQYSQRIKNNRPVVRQRNREAGSMSTSRHLSAVFEEKDPNGDRGQPKLMLSLASYDQVIIQELPSPSPSQSLSSGASSRVPSPCPPLTTSPHSSVQAFHWPEISELRSLYTPTSRLDPGAGLPSTLSQSSLAPEGVPGSSTERGTSSWGSTDCSESCEGSTDSRRGTADCPGTRLDMACEGGSPVGGKRPQPQCHPQQHLPDPMINCYVAGSLNLPNEHKVIIVERVPGREAGGKGKQGDQQGGCQEKKETEEVECFHRAALDCSKTSMLSSGRKTENRLVKNLLERFQSLNS